MMPIITSMDLLARHALTTVKLVQLQLAIALHVLIPLKCRMMAHATVNSATTNLVESALKRPRFAKPANITMDKMSALLAAKTATCAQLTPVHVQLVRATMKSTLLITPSVARVPTLWAQSALKPCV